MVAVSTWSCNKFLDLRPVEGITNESFWQTKEQLQGAVIGIYNGINYNPIGEDPARMMFLWGELRGDFVMPGAGITTDELDVINASILPTNSIANWAPVYRVINLCNTVIDFAPLVKERDKTLLPETYNGYIAEALTIRSLMYFYLVRTFGDVPLQLKATASDDDIERLAKSPKEVILEQIVADLKIAEELAVVTYNNNDFDKGRVTKWTVNAVQADVYLWMDRFADCITACLKIKDSGKFKLVEGDEDWFLNLYQNGNSAESIFELQFDLQPQNLNPFYSMFSVPGRPRLLANPIIMDLFYTVDPLDAENKDIRGAGVAINVADQVVYKYHVNSPDQSGRNWILYRYADVLLMLAEAYIHTGKGLEALDIINEIRVRAEALDESAMFPGPGDINGLTDYILAERAREFAFEGKRWFDLLRNAKRNNFARLDLLRQAAITSVPALLQESALNRLNDPNSLYLPIFFRELQFNPNLVQNPFYK